MFNKVSENIGLDCGGDVIIYRTVNTLNNSEKIYIILDIAQSAVWGDTCLNILGLFRQKNILGPS